MEKRERPFSEERKERQFGAGIGIYMDLDFGGVNEACGANKIYRTVNLVFRSSHSREERRKKAEKGNPRLENLEPRIWNTQTQNTAQRRK